MSDLAASAKEWPIPTPRRTKPVVADLRPTVDSTRSASIEAGLQEPTRIPTAPPYGLVLQARLPAVGRISALGATSIVAVHRVATPATKRTVTARPLHVIRVIVRPAVPAPTTVRPADGHVPLPLVVVEQAGAARASLEQVVLVTP